MSFEIRAPAEDELEEWWRSHAESFGHHPQADDLVDERTVTPDDRWWGVWDGDRCVATTNAYPMRLALPGGVDVEVAGVANVTVASSHRRRGILTGLMEAVHADARARGEVAAILTASDTRIYGRFGYGLASSMAEWTIDTDRAAFRDPVEVAGSFVAVPQSEALEPVMAAYGAQWRARAGGIERSEDWWRLILGPRETWRGGGKLFVIAHHADDGSPDGYAIYRMHHRAEQWLNRWEAEVLELVAVSPEIEAALWGQVLALDLITTVRARMAPVDDALRWRLIEPRQLRARGPIDILWLCVLDVEQFFGQRPRASAVAPATADARGATGAVTVEVDDPFGDQSGRFSFGAGASGCQRTSQEADVRCGIDVLGAVSLGGVTWAQLHRAGRVDERSPGSIRKLDHLFQVDQLPFCSTMF